MNQGMVLVAGMMIGGIAALCIWSLVSFVRHRGADRVGDHRERVMTAVEEKWAEIDELVSSYRNGRIHESMFRASLAEKVETINRIYKPAMHLLDVFFVKYTEKLLEEYGRMIESSRADVQPFEISRPAIIPAAREEDVSISAFMEESRSAVQIQAPETETGISDVEPEIAAPAPEYRQEEETPAEQFIADSAVEKPWTESFQSVPLEVEEPVISEIVAGQKSEDELPLETFLEMETGTGSADEAVELKIDFQDSGKALESEIMPEAVLEETSLPAAEEPMESVEQQEFTPPSPQPGPMPLPLPSTSLDEEITQPATIYDVEAETIIADRNAIIGTQPPPAETEEDKKTLGITGDDVIDTFDKYFGIKR